MVYIDVPGLPRDLDVKYRPPRVSLFPPSYRDRALLRSVHRDVLRRVGSSASVSENDTKKTGKLVTIQLPPRKPDQQKSNFTCQHECSVHTKDSKKYKGSEKQATRDQHNKRRDQIVYDTETDIEDDDNLGNDSKATKAKDKSTAGQDKNKSQKDDPKLKVPDHLRSVLPYPFSSVSADILWGNTSFQRPFPVKQFANKESSTGWNIDHRLETARRADEQHMWSYLSQQEAGYQATAFQWLAQRDAERQTRLVQLTTDLGGLSLDPEVGRLPLNLRLGCHIPQAGHSFQDMHPGYDGHNFNATSLPASIDQHGNIRLADGTMVVISGQLGASMPQQTQFHDQRPPPTSTNPCFRNGYAAPASRQQEFFPFHGFQGHGQQGGFNGAMPSSFRYGQYRNWGSNAHQPFLSSNNQQQGYQNTGNFANNKNSRDNIAGQVPAATGKNDPWSSNGNDSSNASGNNTGQNNDPWGQGNSNQNMDGWGRSNSNKNMDGWRQNSKEGDSHGSGGDNNENYTPKDFDPFQNNAYTQQNVRNRPAETKDFETVNHPFFSDNTYATNNQPADRTMSGAKGLGPKHFPEYDDW